MRDLVAYVRPWDGKQITEPGIYSGMPMSVYHSAGVCDGPSISSSLLRKVESTSMDEVWETVPWNPDREEQDDAQHYARGRARHTLFLGEKGFKEEFVIRPETYPKDAVYPSEIGDATKWTMAAKWCKAWSAAQQMARKAVLPPGELADIYGAAKKLAADPAIQTGLLNGLIEHSIFWKDEKTGLWLKARPDVIPTDGSMLSDYKGTASAQPIEVRRSISDFGYHQQLALGAEGIFQTTGVIITDYVLVFQKWTKPWSINIKPLTPTAIYRGHQQNRRAIDKLAQCIETGVWPGPDDSEVPADLTAWLESRLKKEEEHSLLPEIEEPQAGYSQAERTRNAGTASLLALEGVGDLIEGVLNEDLAPHDDEDIV